MVHDCGLTGHGRRRIVAARAELALGKQLRAAASAFFSGPRPVWAVDDDSSSEQGRRRGGFFRRRRGRGRVASCSGEGDAEEEDGQLWYIYILYTLTQFFNCCLKKKKL